jgi:hypothetical protein
MSPVVFFLGITLPPKRTKRGIGNCGVEHDVDQSTWIDVSFEWRQVSENVSQPEPIEQRQSYGLADDCAPVTITRRT